MAGLPTGTRPLIGGLETTIQATHRFTEERPGHRQAQVTRLAFLTEAGQIFITTDVKYDLLRRNTPPELYTNRTVTVAERGARGKSPFRLDIAAVRQTLGEYAASYIDTNEWVKWWRSEQRDPALEETSMNVRMFEGAWEAVLAGRAVTAGGAVEKGSDTESGEVDEYLSRADQLAAAARAAQTQGLRERGGPSTAGEVFTIKDLEERFKRLIRE